MLFYYLSLIAFTASALESPLTKFMGDPQLFVSAFENADKDTVQKMVDMVDDLLTQLEADRNDAIQSQKLAKQENDDDLAALSKATSEHGAATVNLLREQKTLGGLVALEASHKAIHSASVKALTLATNAYNSAKLHMENTISRVATEKDMLDNVKQMLESTKSGKRNLLSASEADPQAIDRVIKEVDALIEAGVQEQSDATDAFNAAERALRIATDKENAANVQHKKTLNQLNRQTVTVEKHEEILAEKKTVLDTATSVEEKSAAKLVAANDWLAAVLKRAAEEKPTLLEVKSLLQKLL